jgi:hypothetical protein
VYDIELISANGKVETIIPRGELLILEEVYWYVWNISWIHIF